MLYREVKTFLNELSHGRRELHQASWTCAFQEALIPTLCCKSAVGFFYLIPFKKTERQVKTRAAPPPTVPLYLILFYVKCPGIIYDERR